MDSIPKKQRNENGFGHDENEWGFKDDSEDAQWKKHYYDRNKKWRFADDGDNDDSLI